MQHATPFQIGDSVVHPAHGMGRVVRLEEKSFLGQQAGLYYEVAIQQGTVWVPVAVREAPGLRPVTSRRDLARYRSLLKSPPVSLNQDHRKRHVELVDRMRQGSFQILCEVVRDLAARAWLKPLGESDAASLRRAREKLCVEWAASDGITVAAATQEVESLLLESRQAHAVA